MGIPYSSEKDDLYYPAKHALFFPNGRPQSDEALCVEMARLAYCQLETSLALDRGRIRKVLGRIQFTDCRFFETATEPHAGGSHAPSSPLPPKHSPAELSSPTDQVRVLRVVIASPGDVKAERDVIPSVVDEVNRNIARRLGLHLDVCRWETDSYPGFHPKGPQGLIDPILKIENCDVLIGIFWRRFGTPVSDTRSGTEHEFRVAYEALKKNRRPQIMVYFSQKPYTPKSKEDTDQWGRVLQFKEEFPREGLWWDYRNNSEFERLTRNHLTNFLSEQFSTHKPSSPDRAALTPNHQPLPPHANFTGAFLALDCNQKLGVLAFRGAHKEDPTDLTDDLNAVPEPWLAGGNVHSGSAKALLDLWREVDAALQATSEYSILFTGHGIGGAMATLASSLRKPKSLYTFGSPRVGDQAFADLLKGLDNHRYVDCCDLVPRMPPEEFGYRHIPGKIHYIDCNRAVQILDPGDPYISADRSRAEEDYLGRYAWRAGDVASRALADHTPVNYVWPITAATP